MKITVIGGARSGIAAAILAKKLGHEVFLSDSAAPKNETEIINLLEANQITYEFGGNTEKSLDADLLVVSPGVPPTAKVITDAESRSLEIISELEFASQHLQNPIIAVTGTNGKTTVTALIHHILQSAGKKSVAAGNIGRPLSAFHGEIDDETIIVAECSSFQLDRTTHFAPEVAIILNITPDHIDYHGSMDNYVNAKWKTCLRQSQNNLLILNYDDPVLMKEKVKRLSGERRNEAGFSIKPFGGKGIFADNGKIYFTNQHNEVLMRIDELSLPGMHNLQNSLAAALAARAFEVSNENIRDSLMSFKGVEHRLEFIRRLAGVTYINDSKATNINSTWFALSSYDKPIVWIAGGKLAANDYTFLDKLVHSSVKAIIAIGEEKNNIFNHYAANVRCIKCETLAEAVVTARDESEYDDVILFSPACKSFDMFTNFEERGEEFKRLVDEL